ncbi:MAG TPA: DNA-binding response regulator [Pseudonocardiaceae bacterium]|nr:DNA-binding response regulator [Pseudonocardiaceae bacterium]
MTTAPITSSHAGQVTTLRGGAELMARAGHLLAPATEFICAATDTSLWAMTGNRTVATQRVRERLESGVDVYKLYNPVALADPAGVEQLRAIASEGAKVRICTAPLPHETLIVDRKLAVLAGEYVGGERDFTVVTAPHVVASVRMLVLTAWQGAAELADYLPAPPPFVDEAGLSILRTLSAGQKDETAARQLGLSVRTYRRRVAELMELLGASSRFQAGVRARELGLRV